MANLLDSIPQEELSDTLRRELHRWLEDAAFAIHRDELERLIVTQNWTELHDSFYTIIPFGTGGRRGKMGVGPNRINTRTVGESVQGLVRYLLRNPDDLNRRIVIGHDTRHQARDFAETCACILAAHDFTALLFDGFRSTPEVSFAVRYLKADAGIVISASHNPPSDNGFKAYWRDGAQVLPPHDQGIIEEVLQVEEIDAVNLVTARERRLLTTIGAEVDQAYAEAVAATAIGTHRQARLVYTPLHGAGATNVLPVLRLAGFDEIHLVESQCAADGNFPNVANQTPNPEAPTALIEAIALARRVDADIAMASDPDADRLGVAIPLPDGAWQHLSGNQLGAVLTHFILDTLHRAGALPENGVVIKTFVTTDLIALIASAFGVKLIGDLLVGFKHVVESIAMLDDPRQFIFGFEESHGYLRGLEVRDKDAASAALLMAELTAELKHNGMTVYGYLQHLYRTFGYFYEETRSLVLEGSAGSRKIAHAMQSLRHHPPSAIGGIPLTSVIDRQTGAITDPTTGSHLGDVDGTRGDVLIYHLADDEVTKIVIRPSGTEPKLKLYGFAQTPAPTDAGDHALQELQTVLQKRLAGLLDTFEQLTMSYIHETA